MDFPKGATVAVADGERLNLFRNAGDEANPKLMASVVGDVANENKGSGARHLSSSANPDNSQSRRTVSQPERPICSTDRSSADKSPT